MQWMTRGGKQKALRPARVGLIKSNIPSKAIAVSWRKIKKPKESKKQNSESIST